MENFQTGLEETFYDREEFLAWINRENPRTFIGHNILGFDVPVLNRLWGCNIDLAEQAIDSLVLSYLFDPALEGGHSLEAWGERLKFPKGDYSDWSRLTPEMVTYCKNDVKLTLKVYRVIIKKMLKYGYSELSCEIEHKIKVIIEQQQKNGFWFNRVGAESFRKYLVGEHARLAEVIHKLFPPRRTKVAEYPFRRRADGSPFAQYEKHRAKYPEVELFTKPDFTDWYACYDDVPFNIGSPKQRIERLLELGWEPVSFTKTGLPKVDEDALVAFSEALEPSSERGLAVKAIAEWLVIQGRLTMLAGNPSTNSKGWLDYVVDHGNGDTRIHGKVFSCAATTRRMIHSKPNTANIPSGAKAKYGEECRSFWGVAPGRNLTLAGYDAAGLETAGLCHYLNNKSATEILLRPKPNDIHTANARRLTEALGRSVDREWGAKTTWYAWLYGAYPPKLGSILKGSPEDGDVVIDTFFRNVPGLKGLIDDVQYEWKHSAGRLVCIDGGYVICPNKSAALNYKIQSAGAIVMKLTSILLDEEAKKQGIKFKLVGSIHDEAQIECEEERADELGKLAVQCITNAGKQLKFNVELTGDYKIGKDWYRTH